MLQCQLGRESRGGRQAQSRVLCAAMSHLDPPQGKLGT